MPGRQSHGAPRPNKAKSRTTSKLMSRSLNALSIASQQIPETYNILKNRQESNESNLKKRRRRRDEDSEHSNDGEDLIYNKRKKNLEKEGLDEIDSNKGSDSDGNEWKLGQVDPDDDSDLNSDEAFGESDEEPFDGFKFSVSNKPEDSNKKSQKERSLGLNEHNTFVSDPLSDGSENSLIHMPSDDESDDSNNDKLSEDSSNISSSDEDEDEDDETSDPKKMVALQNLISNLSQTNETHLNTRELNHGNEYNLSNFGLTPKSKLTIEDLGLPRVKDPEIKKSIKILESGNGKSSAKLEVPLEKRDQDRLDRSIAYEKSKETLDRWIETVKYNRRAEHITFPLVDHGQASLKSNKEIAPIDTSKPYNELEATIEKILEESGLATINGKNDEDRIREFEELETNKLSFEEVKARRAQLRLAREIMFREEAKTKRIKKIKSKSYRKVHRKQREKLAHLEKQALDESGAVPSEDELESQNRRRAEERMKSKHKGSKWAKAMKETGRVVWDEDVRSGITEMARRDDELRKRVEGKNLRKYNEDSDTFSEFEDGSESDEISKKLLTLKKLASHGESPLIDQKFPGAKILNMEFMRRADAARKRENDAMIEEMRLELSGNLPDETTEQEVEIGRRSFGLKNRNDLKNQITSHTSEFEEPASSNDEEDTGTISVNAKPENFTKTQPRILRKDIKKDKRSMVLLDTEPDQKGGAWSKCSSKSEEVLNSKAPNRGHRRKKSTTVEDLDLSKAEVISKKRQVNNQICKPSMSDDSDSDSVQPVIHVQDKELIERAFAGTDVFGEFEVEKKQTIKDEGDKTIDQTLPGWGSWVGDGLNKKEMRRNRNRFLTKIEGVQAKNRKDVNLERVIINEKKIKKNGKYLASSLPHPFESRRQYERSLRLPIGPEWTTKQTFQTSTKPRILLKQGIINPILHPLL